MGSGNVFFCGMSMDWNDVLADYEGIVCVCMCVMCTGRGYKIDDLIIRVSV